MTDETKEKYAIGPGEMTAYAVAMAMRSMSKRGKLSQEQIAELTSMSDEVYMALAKGKLVSLGDDHMPLIEDNDNPAVGNDTLVI